jgi:hypothetical protein
MNSTGFVGSHAATAAKEVQNMPAATLVAINTRRYS